MKWNFALILDATTNPSLIYKAANLPAYADLVNEAIKYSAKIEDPTERLDVAMDKLAVNFGAAISKLVPGIIYLMGKMYVPLKILNAFHEADS